MEVKKLTKELAEKLMKTEGETRGVVFKTDVSFILKEKGKEGLKEIEQELKRIGYPIDYEKIETMAFYPIGLRILSLLAIQKVFNLSEKDIKRMGSYAPKSSLITKLFMKYFISITKTAEQAPKMWEKHYTVGRLNIDPHEKERWVTVRLKDFALHPFLCPYFEGYFSTVVQMTVGVPVTSKETKCSFKGDKYHEYYFTW